MKGVNVILTNLLILTVGIIFLLVFHRDSVVEWVVILSGALFLITGVINIFVMAHQKRRVNQGRQGQGATSRAVGWLTSAGAIILGAVMLINPTLFVSIFVYIFAIILFLGGCYHIYLLSAGLRPTRFPGWVYILPVVLIVGAVYMFFQSYTLPHSLNDKVLLFSGIGLIIYAITSFIELIGRSASRKAMARPTTENAALDDSSKAIVDKSE